MTGESKGSNECSGHISDKTIKTLDSSQPESHNLEAHSLMFSELRIFVKVQTSTFTLIHSTGSLICMNSSKSGDFQVINSRS